MTATENPRATVSAFSLRDGSQVLIRPIGPGDRRRLLQAFERLGARSRYQRFLGPKRRLTESELDYLTLVDHADHEALGVVELKSDSGVAELVVELGDSTAVRDVQLLPRSV